MSTFTDWNGPQGTNMRASDLVKFADAYAELTTKLSEHINETASSDNVHKVKDYVDSKIAALKKLIPDVSRFIATLDADKKYAEKVHSHDELYAKKEDIENFVEEAALADVLKDYLKTKDLSETDIILAIKEDIESMQSTLSKEDDNTFEMPILKAKKYVEGLIHATEQIQFTDKDFAASVGGSDDVGVYYILGMLTGKAGTAYIKYDNTKPFSANVNFAVTEDPEKGALTVTTDCELEGLKFLIVGGSSGGSHQYLAIQSSEWISKFASTDGVGIFNTIAFSASGINFIPVDSESYVKPNSNCHVICECLSGKGFSFSELASVIIGQMYKTKDDPYVSSKELEKHIAVGTITGWPKYDEDGIAIDVPEAYHACDGKEVGEDDDVSEEFRDSYEKYPLVDYSIIKVKNV